MNRKQLAAFLIVAVIWGSTWAAIRMAVDQLPPMRVAAIRFLIAGLLMLGIARLRRMRLPRGRELRAVLLIGAGMIGIQYALVFSADRYISSGVTAILYAMLPVVVGILTPRIIGGNVPRSAFSAMLVAVGGLAAILGGILSTSASQLIPAITMLAAVIIAAIGSLYVRRELRDLPAFVTAGMQFAVGGAVLAVLSATLERHMPSVWVRQEVIALLFLIFVGSMLAFTLYYWLLTEVQPFRVATIQYVVPLIAVVEGAVLLHERIPLISLIGGAAVLASTWLILRVPENDDSYLSVAAGNLPDGSAETIAQPDENQW